MTNNPKKLMIEVEDAIQQYKDKLITRGEVDAQIKAINDRWREYNKRNSSKALDAFIAKIAKEWEKVEV